MCERKLGILLKVLVVVLVLVLGVRGAEINLWLSRLSYAYSIRTYVSMEVSEAASRR